MEEDDVGKGAEGEKKRVGQGVRETTTQLGRQTTNLP